MKQNSSKCVKQDIYKDTCYIRFGKGKVNNSIDSIETVGGVNWKTKRLAVKVKQITTIRDEWMTLDLDKKGKVIGIELLSSKKARKPCQEQSKIKNAK